MLDNIEETRVNDTRGPAMHRLKIYVSCGARLL